MAAPTGQHRDQVRPVTMSSDAHPESGRPWLQMSYHTLTWPPGQQQAHPLQSYHSGLSRENTDET